MQVFGRGFASFCLLVISGSAMAADDPAGRVVGYQAHAAVTGVDGQQAGEIGLPIFAGDLIRTDRAGRVELIFADQTKLVVGPGSELTIDAYVFSGKASARQISINATKGAFRFITGGSPKHAYEIKTPTATMGIRGTSFDLTVTGEGRTSVALFTGAVRLCGFDGRCTTMSDPCAIAVTGLDQATRAIQPPAERLREIRERFPFVLNQSSLGREFRADTRSCGALGAPGTTGSIGPSPGPSSGEAVGGSTLAGAPAPGPVGDGAGGGSGGGGNPGNGGPGNAGDNPGGNDMGGAGPGASDAGHGGGNGNGNGNGHN